MKTVRCDQCASMDLRRVSDGEYVCNYCQARMIDATAKGPPPARSNPTRSSAPPAPQSLARRALTVLVILGAVFALGGLRVYLGQKRADERRRREIQRSVSRSLATHFGNLKTGLNDASDAPVDRATPAQEFTGEAVVAPKKTTATFTEVAALPDSIGNIYFIGIYKNTGETVIDHPRVEATLTDADQHKVAVASGFAPSMALFPGGEIPVKVLVQHPPAYQSVSYRVDPQPLRYGSPHNFALRVENPRLQPDQFSGYRLTGQITNQDKDTAQFVQIIALLLGEKRQIVGMQEGYIDQRNLGAGDSCPFNLQISLVKGKPSSFKLFTSAMAASP